MVVVGFAIALGGCRDDHAPLPPHDGAETGEADDGGPADGGAETSTTSDDDSGGPDDHDPDDAGVLDPAQRLVRIAAALRGQRPRPADLDWVEEHPEDLATFVDDYMETDEFGEVIRDLHNDALLVDSEFFYLLPTDQLPDARGDEIAKSVLNTPLRLIEHIVREDRPYTEIVTADYWVVDDNASVVWGTAYDPAGPRWQAVTPPDDRPAGGILTDNGFYMRHESCGFNFNRGRANLLTSALLCHDFLTADIDLDGTFDLSDPDAVATAVKTVEACMGCHQTLDPVASSLNAFVVSYLPDAPYDYPFDPMYDDGYVAAWPELTGRPPGFFGQSVGDPGELGAAIADDPRFSLCAAKRFYSYFVQVPLDEVPVEVASELQVAFEDSGFDAKTLVREIMLSDAFARAAAADGDDPDEVIGYKRARPFQLSNLFAQLTGYAWQLDPAIADAGGEPIDLARNAYVGFEVLAGGHDSHFQTAADTTVNATTSLFIKKMATESASFVVEHDFDADPGDRRLLTEVGRHEADEAAIRGQLVSVFRRLYGESVADDDASVDDAYAVFAGVHERTGDVETAWKATLTAMLQDLHIVYY